MRLDSFNEDIAWFASRVRKSGFTFAPEAGSERLRKVINKNISDEDLFNSIKIALQHGWKQLKFYFMIGLPTETEEDIKAIADLLLEIVNFSRTYGKINFSVTISPFSPKAHTPFQWAAQDSKESQHEKVRLLKKLLHKKRFIKLSWRDAEVSQLECALGRGDRKIGAVIHSAWQNGARLDGWHEYFNQRLWEEAFTSNGLNKSDYLGEFTLDQPLPWDHIDKGVSKKFLEKEYNESKAAITLADCADSKCHACGIQRKNSFAESTSCYKNPQKSKLTISRDVSADETDKKLPATGKTWRIQYKKVDYARFIGHLDMIRLIDRLARRAGIPIAHSEGFNPHPKISFAPPLSLGIQGLNEYMDIVVSAEYQGDIKNEFNSIFPDGLEITAIIELQQKTEKLTEAMAVAAYELVLEETLIPEEQMAANLQTILNQEKIEIQRITKGKKRTIDIRPFIRELKLEGNKICYQTQFIDKRNVRLGEMLKLIFKEHYEQALHFPVYRVKQLVRNKGKEISPLNV